MTETMKQETVRGEWLTPDRELLMIGNERFKLFLSPAEALGLAYGLTGTDRGLPRAPAKCDWFDIYRTGGNDSRNGTAVSVGPVEFELDGNEVAEWGRRLRELLRDDEDEGGE
jgi:hypothetical protein